MGIRHLCGITNERRYETANQKHPCYIVIASISYTNARDWRYLDCEYRAKTGYHCDGNWGYYPQPYDVDNHIILCWEVYMFTKALAIVVACLVVLAIVALVYITVPNPLCPCDCGCSVKCNCRCTHIHSVVPYIACQGTGGME